MLKIDLERKRERRKRRIAAILSCFIPGLGQFIRKRFVSGIFFFVIFLFIIWFVNDIWQLNYGFIGFITGLFIFYCFNIIDAYKGPSIPSAPCEDKCPVSINIPFYIALIRAGRFNDALEVIRDRMPFPSVCGRVCYHPCETVCSLREKGGAVGVEFLKRAASDFGISETPRMVKYKNHRRSVGIIGAGPAGLSAGYFLTRKGYPVTIYEKESEPGGLLVYGIPEFRLAKDVVQREINFIRKMGVTINTNKIIGKDILFSTLLEKHSALIISTGNAKSQGIDIPGNELKGIYKAIDILEETNKGNPRILSGTVAVIGGGNSAFDAARCAIRCGAKDVTIYYRRNQKEMPGNIEEMEMAIFEGVKIKYLVAPLQFIGREKVEAVNFVKTELIKQDNKKRSIVQMIDGSNFTVPVDSVIVAIGQVPDFSFLPPNIKQKIVSDNTIIVNHSTMETPLRGIFAAGDITDGEKTVVNAVEMGRKAAIGIDWYLRKAGKLRRIFERFADFNFQPPYRILKKKRTFGNRVKQNLLDREKAVTSFFEVELGFTKEEAIKEASRCLQCNKNY